MQLFILYCISYIPTVVLAHLYSNYNMCSISATPQSFETNIYRFCKRNYLDISIHSTFSAKEFIEWIERPKVSMHKYA